MMCDYNDPLVSCQGMTSSMIYPENGSIVLTLVLITLIIFIIRYVRSDHG